MKFIKNLFLYFSAFVRLFVLLFVKLVVDMLNNNLTLNVLNTINLCLLVTMIVCGIFGLFWNTKLTEEKSHIVKIKSATDITNQYFLQYFNNLPMFFAKEPFSAGVIVLFLIGPGILQFLL